MRNIFVGALLIAVLALFWGERSKSAQISRLKRDLQASKSIVSAVSLETQGKCSKQATIAFAEGGWKRNAFVDYTNHYNAALNKCFVEITDNNLIDGHPSHSTTLADAFEGKVYGTYTWINSQEKKWWEVSPVECTVTTISGEEKHCSSSDEFDALVKGYME
jgi:hypothetical protein